MMEKLLLDLRCPSCNRPVYGTEEVRHVSKVAKVTTTCQHCRKPVKIVGPEKTDLGLEVWYTEDE